MFEIEKALKLAGLSLQEVEKELKNVSGLSLENYIQEQAYEGYSSAEIIVLILNHMDAIK